MDLLFRAWLHSGAEHWRDEIKKRSVYPEYKPPYFQWSRPDFSLIFKIKRFLKYLMSYIFVSPVIRWFSRSSVYLVFTEKMPVIALLWPVWGDTPLFRVEPIEERSSLYNKLFQETHCKYILSTI
jgi:hypothetical protein